MVPLFEHKEYEMEKIQDGILVRENEICPLWETCEESALAPLRECWFCRWSDFRTDTDTYRSVGVCHNPEKNRT